MSARVLQMKARAEESAAKAMPSPMSIPDLSPFWVAGCAVASAAAFLGSLISPDIFPVMTPSELVDMAATLSSAILPNFAKGARTASRRQTGFSMTFTILAL